MTRKEPQSSETSGTKSQIPEPQKMRNVDGVWVSTAEFNSRDTDVDGAHTRPPVHTVPKAHSKPPRHVSAPPVRHVKPPVHASHVAEIRHLRQQESEGTESELES